MHKGVRLAICFSGIILIAFIFSTIVTAAGPQYKDSKCSNCHKESAAVIPKAHPAVDKTASCLSCHRRPDDSKEQMSKYAVWVHDIHQGKKTSQDCYACHEGYIGRITE
jgi:hypothetical protein